MVLMANIQYIEPFECEGESTSSGVRWERWKRALDIYLLAANIESDIRKRAVLLHSGGIVLQEIVYNIPGAIVEPAENIDVYTITIQKLDDYFAPKQSKVYERHIFRLLKQEPAEKFEKFLVRLRHQAAKCHFTAPDENLIDQITGKCSAEELRKKILITGDNITLQTIITEANKALASVWNQSPRRRL